MNIQKTKPALAYVVNSLNPGGTEKLVVEMALTFSYHYKIIVICLDEPGLWADKLRDHSITVYCAWRQPGLDLAVPIRLSRLFRYHDVKLVHAHQCPAWFYCALSRMTYTTPFLLLQEHGRLYPEVESKKRFWFNRLVTRHLTHRFIAVSKDVRTRLARYEGIPETGIEVIYNGVKLHVDKSHPGREELRAQLGLTHDHFVVGTLGRIDPIKNLPLLIESLGLVRHEIPELRALLIGDGPISDDIRALVEARGLSDVVIMTGFRDDARSLIRCLDLFALVSFSEGTSMALLESMASELPAVVTDVGGNPEVVLDGQTGWVIPSESIEALAAVLRDASENRDKCHNFARSARRRYATDFTFDAMISRFQTVYDQMLGARMTNEPDRFNSEP